MIILLSFLLLIVPGMIGSSIYCRLENILMKSIQFFVFVLIHCFLIQLFVFMIFYLRGFGAYLPETVFNDIGGLFKYTALSLIGAVLIPFILSYAHKFKRSKSDR